MVHVYRDLRHVAKLAADKSRDSPFTVSARKVSNWSKILEIACRPLIIARMLPFYLDIAKRMFFSLGKAVYWVEGFIGVGLFCVRIYNRDLARTHTSEPTIL